MFIPLFYSIVYINKMYILNKLIPRIYIFINIIYLSYIIFRPKKGNGSKTLETLNAREIAPLSAHENMFMNPEESMIGKGTHRDDLIRFRLISKYF